MKEVIFCTGNEKIKATHPSTLEITKEDFLTERGDCIIGICASKACIDLNENLKKHLRNGGKIVIRIKVNEIEDKIIAYGHKNLLLKSEKSIVIRKSSFIDERTLAINANKSARDLKRKLIEKIKNNIRFRIEIEY